MFLALRLDSSQILGRGLARLAVANDLERDLLPFVEVAHPGLLDRADVDEDIFSFPPSSG
jgi:hypothetical protein